MSKLQNKSQDRSTRFFKPKIIDSLPEINVQALDQDESPEPSPNNLWLNQIELELPPRSEVTIETPQASKAERLKHSFGVQGFGVTIKKTQ